MLKKQLLAALLLCAISGYSNAQVVSCPGYRTQTQGGWASTPNGSNPGTYLNNNFAAAFPTGLEIGCTNKLRLTSALAVRSYLPQTSTPNKLPSGTLVNPSRSAHKNVFAGQLVTLALNLRFDEYDANFGSSLGRLRDLYIAQGPFLGWTVGQLYDQANRKIGGCTAANFSFADYNNAVDMVNRNYDNGLVMGNYLVCELKISGIKADALCYGDANGSIDLTIVDGVPPYSIQWSNGATSEDLSGLTAGIYTVTVTDAINVSKSLTFEILQPAALIVSGSSVPTSDCASGVCDGSAAIEIAGGTAPYAINWSNGMSGGLEVNGLCAAEEFAVNIVDANGCAAMFDFGGIECTDNGCDTLRTYTIGGWGAQPNGSNPGVYLHANFAGAFPTGITIGCDNTLSLTTAQMVTDWLPSGSSPSLLPAGNMVDDMSYNNVLAAQLVAASLSVGFDAYDPDFASSEDFLGDRYVNVAPFEGMTVSQLLQVANDVIGGCSAAYSVIELNAALTAINENYDNGIMDNGDLTCTSTYSSAKFSDITFGANVYPNPVDAQAIVEINIASETMVSLDITDMAGRIVLSIQHNAEKGINSIAINTKSLEDQVYLVRITADNKTEVKSLAVFH
ncbi:MAG: T9SS type A sorting domain-containing protein [Bacteroidia bacterium]